MLRAALHLPGGGREGLQPPQGQRQHTAHAASSISPTALTTAAFQGSLRALETQLHIVGSETCSQNTRKLPQPVLGLHSRSEVRPQAPLLPPDL